MCLKLKYFTPRATLEISNAFKCLSLALSCFTECRNTVKSGFDWETAASIQVPDGWSWDECWFLSAAQPKLCGFSTLCKLSNNANTWKFCFRVENHFLARETRFDQCAALLLSHLQYVLSELQAHTVSTAALQVNFIENRISCPYVLSFVHEL